MAKRNRQRKYTPPATPAPVNAPFSTEDDLQKEYVSGHGLSFGLLETRIPAQRREHRAPEITFETYRQMMNDPEVSSDVRTLVNMVLADGMQLSPAAEGNPLDSDAPEFAQAEMVASHCTRSFAGLRKSLKKTLKGILEGALTYGHKTAEITWKMGNGEDAGRLVLAKLSQKDYRVLDFVVDPYWNHVGFVPRQATIGSTLAVIPREKFLHFSLLEEDEDPRGRSWIRPVHTAWCFKLLTWPEYRRWLENCALPTTVGKTAPKQAGDVQRNTDGTKKTGGGLLSPAEAMGQALGNLKNASYLVVPNGAEVEQLPPATDGEGFERGIHVSDSQIAKGILYQTLATGEAQHGTRAQSETHLSVLDLIVWELKGDLAETITKDLVEPMIRYNFGEEMLRFTPLVSFGDSERRDWSKDATAASLLEGAVTDSQWNAITNQLGLPAPLPGERPRREASMPTQPENQPTQPASDAPQRKPQQNGAFVALKVRAGA